MKKITLLFLLTALSLSNYTSAKNNVRRIIKEKMVAGTTYVINQYETGSADVENKNGKSRQLIKENKKQCESNFLDNNNQEFDQARKDIVKSVFKDARIKQLSEDNKNNFVVICICDKAGEIKAVSFILVNITVISIQDIKAMEDKYLKLKVKISKSACPETDYLD